MLNFHFPGVKLKIENRHKNRNFKMMKDEISKTVDPQ